MNRAVIISGGNINFEFALDFLGKNVYDYLIGADKGIEFLKAARLTPSHIVGDFDSSDTSSLSYFQLQPEVKIHKFQPEKDMTDTQIAVELAIELGAKSITILGGTGTRIDHLLANISVLSIPQKHGIDCFLVDTHNRITLIDHSFSIKKQEQYGTYISFFAFGKQVEGLTLHGFRYPLIEYTLCVSDSICASNEILEPEAEVTFKEGMLIVIESLD